MKRPGFDFSKEGLQRFFLHHAEKVVFVGALLLAGVLFWFGYKSEVFTEKEPKQLAQMADEAHRYIVNDTSWDVLKDKRQGDDTVHLRIQNSNERVNLDQLLPNYADGLVTGVPERTLNKRMDPVLIPPTELVARSFRAPILFNTRQGNGPLDALPIAGSVVADDDDSRRSRRDEMPEMGEAMPEYAGLEVEGLRPLDAGVADDAEAISRDVVVITGVIDMDAQWKEYEILEDSMGYFPPRDKPNYRYLQVQRRQGADGEWEDINQEIERYQPYFVGSFPQLDPDGEEIANGKALPEVVAPEHYDPALTGPLPSFTQFDVLSIANHAGPTRLGLRPIPEARVTIPGQEEKSERREDPFGGGGNSTDAGPAGNAPPNAGGGRDRGGRGQSGRELSGRGKTAVATSARLGSADIPNYKKMATTARKQTSHKLVRFFDILPKDVEPGTEFQYRILVWLDDPNNERPKDFVVKKSGGRDERDAPTVGSGAGGSSSQLGEEGGAGGGADAPVEEEEKFTYVAAEDAMKAESVRERIREAQKKELPKELDFLRYARCPTDAEGNPAWIETNSVVVGESFPSAYVYAGGINLPRQYRLGDRQIDAEPRSAKIAVEAWEGKLDGRDYDSGIPIPARRDEVYASEVLAFSTPTNILHPADWSVRHDENAKLNSTAMIVDVMGGDEVKEISSRVSGAATFSMNYSLPGEVLVFDFDRNLFAVSSDIDDRGDFLKTCLLPDEVSAFGGKAAKEEPDDDEDRSDRNDRSRNRGGGNPFGG